MSHAWNRKSAQPRERKNILGTKRTCAQRVLMPDNPVAMIECDRCDGCGWYEGGPTLKTTCEVCAGTGVVQGARQ